MRYARWCRCTALVASIGLIACSGEPAERQAVGRLASDLGVDFPIEVIDHRIPVAPVVPCAIGPAPPTTWPCDDAPVFLNLREFRPTARPASKAVVMLHGASVPSLAGFDLGAGHYDWARWLARSAGFDVFVLDLQGFGLSHHPAVMDDPCNAPAAEQAKARPPLTGTCPATYPFQLASSRSDWAELDAAVDHVRSVRDVEKVNLIAWSQGSFRAGPYAVMHPEKVESVFLLAPVFNPVFRSNPPVSVPAAGTPMMLRTRADLVALWDAEEACEGQREPGIEDRVWSAIMEQDPVGRGWGPPPAGAPEGASPEGLLRVRTVTLWGWNTSVAAKLEVPLLIIQGQFDEGGGALQRLDELYDIVVRSPKKLRFRVECAGHFIPWESRRRVVHQISKEWIGHGSVAGLETGEFFIDTEGELLPCDPPPGSKDPNPNECAVEHAP